MPLPNVSTELWQSMPRQNGRTIPSAHMVPMQHGTTTTIRPHTQPVITPRPRAHHRTCLQHRTNRIRRQSQDTSRRRLATIRTQSSMPHDRPTIPPHTRSLHPETTKPIEFYERRSAKKFLDRKVRELLRITCIHTSPHHSHLTTSRCAHHISPHHSHHSHRKVREFHEKCIAKKFSGRTPVRLRPKLLSKPTNSTSSSGQVRNKSETGHSHHSPCKTRSGPSKRIGTKNAHRRSRRAEKYDNYYGNLVKDYPRPPQVQNYYEKCTSKKLKGPKRTIITTKNPFKTRSRPPQNTEKYESYQEK